MRAFAILPVALVAFASFGCIPQDKDADDPSTHTGPAATPQSGPYGGAQPNPMPNGAVPPYGAPPSGQYNPAPAPGAPGAPPPGAAGGAATPIAPGMAVVASVPLQAMASQEAPGMTADGGAFAGQFQEGQVLEQPINLQPNKCYTVLATGIGVQELSIQLVTQPMPGMPPIVLAQSNGGGPNAALGGGKNCWRFMSPIGGPGKVLLKATKGAGTAAAQVFIKS